MFESQTTYWPVCDGCGAAGPIARTAHDAWAAATAGGWHRAEGRTPIVKAAYEQTLCPGCPAHRDTDPAPPG